jgi:hypothetical protein
MSRVKRTERACLLAVACLVSSTAAKSQELVIQTLDRVAVNSTNAVLEMQFADPLRSADFVNTGVAGSAFRSCILTAINGLFCLDGNVVLHWPNTEEPGEFDTVVDCRDAGLNLDPRSSCTGLTVDSTGAIWIAGKTKGKTHSLVKVVERPAGGTCPAGFAALTLTDYCADEVATGRPLLVDITSIDGDVAEDFTFGAGILGLEERKTAEFFPDNGAPIQIASGKSGWNLVGNEELLSIGLLQIPNPSGGIENHIMVTTSLGRVLTVDASGGSAVEAFHIIANREPSSVQCNFNAPMYGIRASSKSGLVYVTDRQYCEVIALQPVPDGSGNFSHLVNAVEPIFDQSGNQTGQRNLTLSTAAGPSATFPPEGPSVAPGIGIDLDDCASSCTLVIGDDGDAAATLSNVTLASQESGMTLFQVKNVPDCRYVPQVCRDLLGVQNLVQAGVVVDPQGTGIPAAQLLNLTSLLPLEITELFAATGGLPDLLMSRQYRGQRTNDFTFEMFVGVTEEGVVFQDTFNAEFDVAALAGAELGCELNLPPASPLFTENEGQPDERIGTLNWDVVTTVSERFVTFTDPQIGPGPQFVDTLTNVDCGSSRTIGSRWSLKPYNLEITPCSWNGDPADVWASDGSCPVGGPELPDDAVLAKLLISLYDDLGDALNQLACTDVDAAGLPPLSASSCSTLNATWLNGKDKLDKCWEATQQPKQSSGSQNCQAFVSQLTGFSNTLAGVASFGPDPANRKGELRARVETLFHLYEERFFPSIPAAGFAEP